MHGVFTGDVFTPVVERAEGMVEALAQRWTPIAGRRFLHLRAPQGRETAIEMLEAQGAIVDAIEAYRIVPADPASEETIRSLEGADVFTFLSGETLACFMSVVPEAKARDLLARARVAVIGPIAKERADALGVRVDVVARETTVESLVAALTEP
jgi:uroporphyrinogen III methyltransferase/synthase